MARNVLLAVVLVGALIVVAWLTLRPEIASQGSGQVTQLNDNQLCLQPGDPSGNDACYQITADSELPDSLEVGEQVTVTHDHQKVVSVESIE